MAGGFYGHCPGSARSNPGNACDAQVAQLSARVQQLTAHLQTHRKDFACRRGLVILLGQRRRLMQYLYKVNRCARHPAHLHARCGRFAKNSGWQAFSSFSWEADELVR